MFENGSIGNYRKIFIKCGYTDLRCGIRSLSEMLRLLYNVSFEEGDLYVFCGKSAKTFKGLIYEKEGFLLVSILLDVDRVKWIRDVDDIVEITSEQFQRILKGNKDRE